MATNEQTDFYDQFSGSATGNGNSLCQGRECEDFYGGFASGRGNLTHYGYGDGQADGGIESGGI